jgi:hypothetical protein
MTPFTSGEDKGEKPGRSWLLVSEFFMQPLGAEPATGVKTAVRAWIKERRVNMVKISFQMSYLRFQFFEPEKRSVSSNIRPDEYTTHFVQISHSLGC